MGASILALCEPLLDARRVENMRTWQLHNTDVALQLRQADPALRGRGATAPWQHTRQLVDEAQFRSVVLGHRFIEFAQELEVFWLDVPEHDVSGFVLSKATWQRGIEQATAVEATESAGQVMVHPE